jgi:hypothetical protein
VLDTKPLSKKRGENMDITGYVDELRQPRIKLTVKGNRKAIGIFDGYLSLPVAVAIPLGLELKGRVPVEFADGSMKNELTFRGTMVLQGHEYQIEIFLTESKYALIGSGLMQGQKLAIDYAFPSSSSPRNENQRNNESSQ